MEGFDIIEYISGLTGFVFDKAVLKDIALSRGVENVTLPQQIDLRTRELLRADLLYTAYCSPNTMASVSHSHGSYTKSYGHQTVTDKDALYKMFMAIYRKYDDPIADSIEGGTVQWLNAFEDC